MVASLVPAMLPLMATAWLAQTTTSATWVRMLATLMPLAATPTATTHAPAMTDTLAMEDNAWI